jgi:hypothetical protein
VKTIFFVTLLSIWFFLPPGIYGYDEERATANLASEFAQCSAFYTLSAEGIKRTGDEGLVIRFMEASKTAYDYSVKFSNQKVAEARIRSALDEQRKELGYDSSNFMVLILKYGEMCKDDLHSPKKRLQYWLDRKD